MCVCVGECTLCVWVHVRGLDYSIVLWNAQATPYLCVCVQVSTTIMPMGIIICTTCTVRCKEVYVVVVHVLAVQ